MNTPKKPTCFERLFLPIVAVLLLAGAAAEAASYPATVLADNPVGYWRLEELNPMDPAADSSASGLFPGVYNGTPILNLPGIETNSVRLNGSSPVSVGYYSALNPTTADNGTGAFSFEIWARPLSAGTSGAYRCPIGNFTGWGTVHGWIIYQTPDPGSQFTFLLYPGNDSVGGAFTYEMGKWYHLVGTYDGLTAKFYVNGQLRSSKNFVYGVGYVPNEGTALQLGERGDGYGGFDGYLDEAAVYTNALTDAQVLNHYMVGTNSFYTPPQAPSFTLQPVDTTNYSGTVVKFTSKADGYPQKFSYQWYKGASPILDATNASYSFTCTLADNLTTYKVTAANGVNPPATSVEVTLTVITNLEIYLNPTSITRTEGSRSKAAFITLASGAQPLTYQWYKDAAPIPGANSPTLWLSGLTVAADDGKTFYCKVTTPYGIADSTPATLSVQARAINVPITKYAKMVVADDPVAYWRLDEPDGSTTATDVVGSFDGTYTPGSGAIVYSVPTGIPHESDTAVHLTNHPSAQGATVRIPYALELNPFGPFSVDFWLQPSRQALDGNDYRTAIASQRSGDGPVGWNLYLQPNNQLAWVVWGGHWSSLYVGAATPQLVGLNWYHVALTYDGTVFTIYVNGVARGSAAFPSFVVAGNKTADGAYSYTYDGTGDFTLGWRTDNDWKAFPGSMDDVAVYNKALTPDQVMSHYMNQVKLTSTRVGSDIVLSWPFGTLQWAPTVTGAYTEVLGATSPYTNSVSGGERYYRVQSQ